jgi:hypothetical protein
LLGRTERSSPEAAQRRAAGAGLDGEGSVQAIIVGAVMSVAIMSAPFREADNIFARVAHLAPFGKTLPGDVVMKPRASGLAPIAAMGWWPLFRRLVETRAEGEA